MKINQKLNFLASASATLILLLTFVPITVLAASNTAVSGSALAAINYQDNPRVYYLGSNNHVYELGWSGTQWKNYDVTSKANG